MTTVAGARADWRLLVGPGLLVVGVILLKVSNDLGGIGPLDRAAFGWLIPVPMLLLAPAAIGLAARSAPAGAARRLATLDGVILAVAVGIAWFASTKQVGCNQDPDTLRVVAASIPVPLVLGLGWAGAGWLSIRFAEQPIVAILAGVAGAIGASLAALLTFAVLFPGLSCAYVPPPV